MIGYEAFGTLRLRDLVDEPAAVAVLEDWEYMDDLWVGEAVGFTEFLRLDEDPGTLRAASLHLEALGEGEAARILGALALPLRRGMPAAEVTAALGPPREVLSFGPDRSTYGFRCGSPDAYDVFCVVEDAAGLTHVSVIAPTPKRLAVDAE